MKPGGTLGILGGGQLGRLIAQAAKELGFKTAALDASASNPALQVVDLPVVGPVADADAARGLAEKSDVVTLEWELIPVPVLEYVAKLKPTYPGPNVLSVIQDRLVQKRFLEERGFAQAEFGEPGGTLPFPVIIKRRTHGYDGKGQVRIDSAAELPRADEVLKAPCVWEKVVEFEREISVILARGRKGEISVFPVAENLHRRGILHATRAPAPIPDETARRAEGIARSIADGLGHVGVMAVEMFLLPNGKILVNEIAPRVHNSGHYTLGGCETSQFEQHVRAVCGLPFGSTKMKGPALMVNLLGDVWRRGEPRWDALEGIPGCALHLYGKSEARPGRKMGHYTVVGPAALEEWDRVDERLAVLEG